MALIPNAPLSHREGRYAEERALANGDTLTFSGAGHSVTAISRWY